ncbi:hypothetical protein Hanom_Chr15g01410171 [Helianthus anomalus]
MTSAEEAIIDRINHLTVGLENCLQEVNLLHQRLNILAMPPMEPIFPQGDWNLAQEIIIPTGWDDLSSEPPLDALNEVPVVVAPPLKMLSMVRPSSFSLGRLRNGLTTFEEHPPE